MRVAIPTQQLRSYGVSLQRQGVISTALHHSSYAATQVRKLVHSSESFATSYVFNFNFQFASREFHTCQVAFSPVKRDY